MKRIKRIIASVMTVAMMFSMVVPANAANFSDVSGDAKAAVSKVAGVGIVNGYEDGTFKPQGELKRSEAAKIMVEMLGLGSSAEAAENKQSRFTDVEAGAWYNGYVIVAESRGIIKGMGDDTFAPEAKVTNDQVITMMVRAIGAGPVADADEYASWPDNYKNLAMDINLTEGVNFGAGFAPATRGDMAKFVVNTLETNKWKRQSGTNQGESTYVEVDELLMNDVLDVDMYKEAVLTATKTIDNSLDDNEIELDFDNAELNGEETSGSEKFELAEGVKVDVDALIGVSVDVWVNSDDEVTFIAESEDADEETVKFVEIDSIETDKLTVILEDGDEEEYDVADTYTVYLNRTKLIDGLQDDGDDNNDNDGSDDDSSDDDNEGLDSFEADEEYIYGTLTLDRNGDVANIIANLYDNAVVVEKTRYDEDDEKLKIYHDDDVTTDMGGSNEIFDLDDTIIRDEDGNVVEYDEIEEGDLVLYTDNNVLVLKGNTVEGMVERRSTRDIEIDDERFKFNNGFVEKEDFNIDDEVVIYLDVNGKIVAMKELEGAAGSDDNYAIITEFYAADDTSGKGSDFDTTVELTLMDGTVVTKEFDLDETEEEFDFDSDTQDDLNTFDELNDLFDTDSATTLANYREDLRDLLGTLVKFETFDNGEKVKFLEFESRQGTREGDLAGDDDEEIIKETAVDFELNNDEDELRVKDGSLAFLINEDTKVFIAKAENDTENGTLTDVEQIDWDALDGVTNLDAYFAEVDDRTDEVGYVFIPFNMAAGDVTQEEQSFSVDTTNYIGIVADGYYEGNDDYSFEIIVNGEDIDASTEMVYVEDSDDLDSSKAEDKEYQAALVTVRRLGTLNKKDITVTTVTDLFENGDMIVAKATALTSSKVKYKTQGLTGDDAELSAYLSDDVVFVEAEVDVTEMDTTDANFGKPTSNNMFDYLVMGDEADVDTIDDSEDMEARGTLLWMVENTDGEITAVIYADSSTEDDVDSEVETSLTISNSPTVTTAAAAETISEDASDTIEFSEALSATGKSNVETAVNAAVSTSGTSSYALNWNGIDDTLTIEYTYGDTNIVVGGTTADLEDLAGNTTEGASIIE